MRPLITFANLLNKGINRITEKLHVNINFYGLPDIQ